MSKKKVILSENAEAVAKSRYFMEGEDWDICVNRVSKGIAAAEITDEAKEQYTEEFVNEIYPMNFMPAGRILRNTGRPRGSLLNCISEDSELITPTGFVKVKDLIKGDLILNGKGKFDHVKDVWSNGKRNKLINIELKGLGSLYKIKSTGDHKFYTFSFNSGFAWKEAKDLDLNADYMVHPRISCSESMDSLSVAGVIGIDKKYEIVDGFIQLINNDGTYNIQTKKVKNNIEINRDFCRLVGYYLAEGTSIDNGNSVLFSFNESELNYINDVINLSENIFGVTAVIRNNTGNSKQVVINSRIINNFFENLFGKFSKDKKLPWFWFNLTEECLYSTLAGFIRGDGTYTFGKQFPSISVSTVNKFLMYQIYQISEQLNISTSMTYHIGRATNYVNDSDRYSDVYRVNYGLRNNTFKLLTEVLGVNFHNYSFYPINNICEVDYDGEVYDISMDDETEPHFSMLGCVAHNCFNVPTGDSIEQIGQHLKDCLTLWSDGGGVGTTFTPLRPKGTPIAGKGGHSSGLVSFIEAADHVSNTIESGGSRRAAALAAVDVSHPEIMDFIDAKLTHGTLSHFNISVIISRDFLSAVEAGAEWEFRFNQKSYGSMPARKIWEKIVTNMVKCAEPGILVRDNFSKNNSYYFDPIVGFNPCGEATLGAYGACDLGSLNLPNFITGNVNTNWRKLEQTIRTSVRFLDNVLDVNKYSLHEVQVSAMNSRRIGLGVMGLAEYLFAKGVRYGSIKATHEVEKLMRFIRDITYMASVELAAEKGAFPKFDPVLYGRSSFVQKLPAKLRMAIKKHGIRNVTCMAFAPTGTISLIPEVTGGIEPLFSKGFIRKDRVSERVYIHPLYQKIIMSGQELPDWFVDSFDLKPEDHFEMQALCQKYVDGAVSKTINMPKGTTDDQLSDLLLEYANDLKGVTVYVDGSREGAPLTPITHEKAVEYINSELSDLTEDEVGCATGTCEI